MTRLSPANNQPFISKKSALDQAICAALGDNSACTDAQAVSLNEFREL
jgi:hypothetical protein